MSYQFIIVRAYLGEPLRRVKIGSGDRVIFVASEESLERVRAGESVSIGFPKEDVFEFEDDAYSALKMQWGMTARTGAELWRRLKPIGA